MGHARFNQCRLAGSKTQAVVLCDRLQYLFWVVCFMCTIVLLVLGWGMDTSVAWHVVQASVHLWGRV